MGNSIIRTIHQIKEDEMGSKCSAHGRNEEYIRNFCGTTWKKPTTWKM